MVILINMGILYAFASLAGNPDSIQVLFNFIIIWGINFFMPFAYKWLKTKGWSHNSEYHN